MFFTSLLPSLTIAFNLTHTSSQCLLFGMSFSQLWCLKISPERWTTPRKSILQHSQHFCFCVLQGNTFVSTPRVPVFRSILAYYKRWRSHHQFLVSYNEISIKTSGPSIEIRQKKLLGVLIFTVLAFRVPGTFHLLINILTLNATWTNHHWHNCRFPVNEQTVYISTNSRFVVL